MSLKLNIYVLTMILATAATTNTNQNTLEKAIENPKDEDTKPTEGNTEKNQIKNSDPFSNVTIIKENSNNDIKNVTIENPNQTIDNKDPDGNIEEFDNNLENDTEYDNLTREEFMDLFFDAVIYPQPYEWPIIAIHTVVFIVGLIGNFLVCTAVYRNHSMRTVTNYFIVNLAVADFMVILICLPPTVLWDVTLTWFFGTAMCKIVLYLQSVSVTVSVMTLTFISVDRWYAICFPLKFKSTTGRAKTAIVIIWVLSLLFNIPEFLVLQVKKLFKLKYDVSPYLLQCRATWSDESELIWHVIQALFLYTANRYYAKNDVMDCTILDGKTSRATKLEKLRFPLLLMTIAYYQIVKVLWKSDNIPGHAESHKLCTSGTPGNWLSNNRRSAPSVHTNASTEGQLRSRRKAAKMLVAVVVMFAVCYFPVHLLNVLRGAFDLNQGEFAKSIALISHVLCYANSAINPLIYNFMSGKFRREFHRSYFKCFCCCLRESTTFAPIGSSRAGTTRTIIRRNDSCASHKLTHFSPANQNATTQNGVRNTNTSFIEINGNNSNGIGTRKNDKLTDSIINQSNND